MKRWVLLILVFAMILPFRMEAQKSLKSESFIGDVVRYRSGSASLPRHVKSGDPTYQGYEISLSLPRFALVSNVAALNKLPMSYTGANVGYVRANRLGKLKTTMGYYESDPSVPYDMNMYQGSFSASVYPLRLLSTHYHTFEPYFSAGLSYQLTRFRGTYLPDFAETHPNYNYSSAEEPLIGKTGVTQANLGFGVEYQLVSYNVVFVHLFAEMTFGKAIAATASNRLFAGTRPVNPAVFTLGINFGLMK
jgi:hypothetical protein